MKKISLTFLFFCLLILSKKSSAFTVHLTGAAIVCPGSSQTYSSDINVSPGTYKIVWTCGGVGVFHATGTTNYTVFTSLNNGTALVDWTATNGVTSWVTATYYYSILGINYTNSATESVDLGLVNSPTAINSFSSLCINNSASYTVSCPTALPAVASTGDATFPPYSTNSYVWTVTNATISGSGSSATLTCISTNNNPIVVSVKFYSTCGYSSGTFSKTITRSTGPPATPSYLGSNPINVCLGSTLNWGVSPVPDANSYAWSTTSSHAFLSPSGSLCEITGINGPGSAVIVVKAVNTCGSSAGKSSTITVSNTGPCTPKSFSSIDEAPIVNGVTIFPNPASENLTIDITSAEEAHYIMTLYDITGKKIAVLQKDVAIGSNQATMELGSINNGIYFINIDNGTTNQQQKIVVTH